MEKKNIERQERFRLVEATEVRYQEYLCEDADYLIVAFGSAARISQKAVETLRAEGIKVGMLRPITLWPFPTKVLAKYAEKVKSMLSVELNAGQMIEDVRLSVNGKVPVFHYGRMGGVVPNPEEIVDALKKQM
jgi:2-oxoglutarate ferredoxin oxidoreductase subunit alpha